MNNAGEMLLGGGFWFMILWRPFRGFRLEAVVQLHRRGDLIESFCGRHLSDPFCDEASRAFGSLRVAVLAAGVDIRNVLLATVSQNSWGNFGFRLDVRHDGSEIHRDVQTPKV